jgi:hypothetical protein
MCWKRSLAISLASAALALSGCGGDEEPAVNTGDPTPAAEFSQPTHPVISDPVNGATIKADEQENDLLTAAVNVTGVAEPNKRVVVSTGCDEEDCKKGTLTGSDGAYEVELKLAVEAETPRGTIVVGYENSGESVDSDRVIVTVEPPSLADLPTEDNTSKSSKKKKKSSKKKAAPLPTTAAPEATAPPANTAPSTSSGTTTSARNLVVIGDSLAVGMQPYLQQFLPGWNITVDARTGRPLAEGMSRFDAKPDPSSETVYAFSLGTNDGPTNTTALENAVKRSTTKGCAVWSTIVRPPVGGTSYDGINSRLNGLASSRVKIVQWASQVANNRGWIAGDGVHANATGYKSRAALYAAAIKTCSS